MGKAARLKQQQRRVPPPPRAGASPRVEPRLVWLGTGGLVALVTVLVVVLLVTRTSPKVAAAAPVTAADKNASASLISAANKVGFHPTTEPGVGEVEGQPASAAVPPTNPNLLAVGSTAPNFTLTTPQGKRVSLASYRGKAVLLEFFASWCPHCNAEAPHLAKLARSLSSKGAQFVSVNADGETAPSIYAFHRYYGLPYPALVDPSGTPGSFNSPGAAGNVSTTYRVQSFPTFYVIDRHGKIAWRSDGEQPDALLRSELLAAARA
jgi:peroxiredoxin